MRIFILGGDGMLGHQLLTSWQDKHEVRVSLRAQASAYQSYGIFHQNNSDYAVDVFNFSSVEAVIQRFQPEVVINAIGIVKQRTQAKDAILSLEVNALFPHRLSQLCAAHHARLIHISTDCVFSGQQGMYNEDDLEDARDLYGRSKLLGELHEPHTLTLRTSIIGLELARHASLIEWFLAQHGTIQGFKHAIYAGFTTAEMARIIDMLLCQHPHLSGLWHVASTPINKYDLLSQLQQKLKRKQVSIIENLDFHCERSLDARRFQQATAYKPPTWDVMLAELAQQIEKRST